MSGGALELRVFVSPSRPLRTPGGGTFSPVTSSLVCGASEAILVDSQHVKEDVDALAAMIEETGLRLATIFVTHGHADHYFGSARLAARFPGVRVVATRGVVDYIHAHREADRKQWAALFGDDVAPPDLLPSPLDALELHLDGHRLPVLAIGQGDIAPSTALHVPPLDAVVVGDICYNRIHPMLALGGPAQWRDWIASIDRIEALSPRTVVAGHKRPDASDEDLATILDGTRAYIRDFAAEAAGAASASKLIAAMTARYPDYGNPWTLVFSATTVMRSAGS